MRVFVSDIQLIGSLENSSVVLMNRSASFDTCEHFGVSDERCCYVRDANGQIVFTYGSRESEACVDSNYISWEEKVDQVIGIV